MPNPEGLRVRRLEASDIDEVVALALRAWAPVHESMATVLGKPLDRLVYPHWAASQARDVRAVCVDPEEDVSVATDIDNVLGFVAVVIRSPDEGEIDMIAVDPSAQRRGVGHLLTDHALSQIRIAGCRIASVATGGDPGHAAARALYAASGFTPLPLVRYYRAL